MRNVPHFTQSSTKRIVAAALAALKAARQWSNGDLGDALGCGEGTARNRLCDDDTNNQMPVHELRRLIASGELSTVNAIVADLGVHVEPDAPDAPGDPLQAAAASSRCSVALIEASADGRITDDEWRVLIPLLEDEDRKIGALLAQGRRQLAEDR